MYVYIKSEPGLWTVGHGDPAGIWHAESDHDNAADAAARVAYLNGGRPAAALESAVTAPGSLDRLAYIVAEIDAFEDTCRVSEETDTGEAWQLLQFIRESLAGPRIEVTEHRLPDGDA